MRRVLTNGRVVQGGPSGRIVGWLTLICNVPPFGPAAQPLLPISHQPKQNQAEGGTNKIEVNPTQLSDQMDHPVVCLISGIHFRFNLENNALPETILFLVYAR